MLIQRKRNAKISQYDYPDYVVIGLGNPKSVYENTRHNIGFRAVDYLAEHGAKAFPCKRLMHKALIGKFEIAGYNFVLAKPQTYMNLSGVSAKAILDYYGFTPDKLIVIHDDVELPIGAIRIKMGGTGHGHKGVENICGYLCDSDFLRIRVGIGKKPPRVDLAEYVLSQFTDEENEEYEKVFPMIYNALDCMLRYGVERMMTEYNCTGKN